jgi:hypothetical protein
MRVVTVLLALVATPFVMGVSQTGSGLPGRSSCVNGQSGPNRSAQGTANAHKGLCVPQDPPPPPPVLDTDSDGVPDNLDTCPGTPAGTTVDASGCPVQTPPPPPPTSSCVASAPSNAGTLFIEGQVLLDTSPWPGQANWCIHLTGTVTATALTDASGSYRFTGLPWGTYTVCEDVQSGWVETFPTSGTVCPTGFGWSFPLNGASASFNNFWNLPAP